MTTIYNFLFLTGRIDHYTELLERADPADHNNREFLADKLRHYTEQFKAFKN